MRDLKLRSVFYLEDINAAEFFNYKEQYIEYQNSYPFYADEYITQDPTLLNIFALIHKNAIFAIKFYTSDVRPILEINIILNYA